MPAQIEGNTSFKCPDVVRFATRHSELSFQTGEVLSIQDAVQMAKNNLQNSDKQTWEASLDWSDHLQEYTHEQMISFCDLKWIQWIDTFPEQELFHDLFARGEGHGCGKERRSFGNGRQLRLEMDDVQPFPLRATWKNAQKSCCESYQAVSQQDVVVTAFWWWRVHRKDKRLDGLRYAVLVGFGAWLHGYWALGLFAGYLGWSSLIAAYLYHWDPLSTKKIWVDFDRYTCHDMYIYI